jgi:hypothetical protein
MNLQQQGANALRRGQERAGMWDVAGNIGKQIASFGMSSAGGMPSFGGQSSVNLQGQQSPLYNNSAFVSRM